MDNDLMLREHLYCFDELFIYKHKLYKSTALIVVKE